MKLFIYLKSGNLITLNRILNYKIETVPLKNGKTKINNITLEQYKKGGIRLLTPTLDTDQIEAICEG
jgi:hypothetical protein